MYFSKARELRRNCDERALSITFPRCRNWALNRGTKHLAMGFLPGEYSNRKIDSWFGKTAFLEK
jgi:hypothetical protein